MAIVLRGQSSLTTGSSVITATATAVAPGSPLPGDLALVWLIGRAAVASWTSTGFTVVPVVQANTLSIQLLWRFLDGSEGWPISVVCAVNDNFAGQLVCYGGVSRTLSQFDPVPAVSGNTNPSSTNITPTSITTAAPGDQLVWFGGVRSTASGGVPPTVTPPPGAAPTFTTQGSMVVTSAGSVVNVGCLIADGTWAGSGAIQPVGTCTATINAGFVVSLFPAGPPAASGLVTPIGSTGTVSPTSESSALGQVAPAAAAGLVAPAGPAGVVSPSSQGGNV